MDFRSQKFWMEGILDCVRGESAPALPPQQKKRTFVIMKAALYQLSYGGRHATIQDRTEGLSLDHRRFETGTIRILRYVV